MQKNEDIAGADFETLVTFSVLTPVVYLYLTEHIRHILPVTCSVLMENRCALQNRNRAHEVQGREKIRCALKQLSDILRPDREACHEQQP